MQGFCRYLFKKGSYVKPHQMISAVFLLHIKSRVHIVDIFLIQFLPQQLHGLTEPLEMDDLPFPQELDHIIDIGIIGQPENIVVGHTGFLFWFVT